MSFEIEVFQKFIPVAFSVFHKLTGFMPDNFNDGVMTNLARHVVDFLMRKVPHFNPEKASPEEAEDYIDVIIADPKNLEDRLSLETLLRESLKAGETSLETENGDNVVIKDSERVAYSKEGHAITGDLNATIIDLSQKKK